MCTFRKHPRVYVPQRLRVYRQNGRMLEHMRAFCQYTRNPFECTHGGVLNLSTGGLPLSPLLLLSFLLSLFLRSLSLHSSHSLCSLPSALCSLLFSLSNYDNDHSSGRVSLYTRLLSECVGFGPFLGWRLCSNHARNNCPGITVQASCHLE